MQSTSFHTRSSAERRRWNRRLRLKGRGLPDRQGKPGNFYAELQIRVPTTLTDDEQGLFEELAKVSGFDARSRR